MRKIIRCRKKSLDLGSVFFHPGVGWRGLWASGHESSFAAGRLASSGADFVVPEVWARALNGQR